jgi:hypothetical protein
VADVTVVVCLDVASPTIRCLELPLNDEIRAVEPRRVNGVIAAIFGLEPLLSGLLSLHQLEVSEA